MIFYRKVNTYHNTQSQLELPHSFKQSVMCFHLIEKSKFKKVKYSRCQSTINYITNLKTMEVPITYNFRTTFFLHDLSEQIHLTYLSNQGYFCE